MSYPIISRLVTLLFSLLFISFIQAQVLISEQEYDSLKSNNLLHQFPGVQVSYDWSNSENAYWPELETPRSSRSSSGCGCYIEPDTSYTLAMQPNDDGSQVIAIPFQFCFYGTSYDSLYINNNGNISFGAPYITFSGVAFPSNQYVMIAPFWGDVDTRGAGEVLYKTTSSSLIINWKDVGYFNSQTDKLSSFQLIITDGTDSLLTGDNNVAFCYKDMQWTTGSASGGTNGFGGTPATVGANKGDGIDFVQFGRFDAPGTLYNGPFDTSQVSWLDNQSFYFNACNSSNIPPVMTGLNQCDTIGSCVGDTFFLDISVLSPEQGQITETQILSAPPSFVLTNNITGNSSDVSGYMIGDINNAGYNVISLMSFDNGTPADTIYTNIVVFVDVVNFEPEILGDTVVCDGDTTTLSLSDVYDSYRWTGGSTDSILQVTGGTYVVTASRGLCSKKDTHIVDIQVLPDPQITGDIEFCENGSTDLAVADTFDLINWSTGSSNPTINVADSGIVKVVVEKWGCDQVDSVNIIINPLPSPTVLGDTSYCLGSNTILSVPGYVSYQWSNGETTSSILVTQSAYYAQVTDAKGCVGNSDTAIVIELNPDERIIGDTTICEGYPIQNTLSGADGNMIYAWSTGDSTQQIDVGVGDYQLVVVDSFGCFDSSSIEIFYIPTPEVDFTISPDSFTVKNGEVIFTDRTLLSSGAIESYEWEFDEIGVEGRSDQWNPIYRYRTKGEKVVTLTVTAENQCIGSLRKDYFILEEIPATNVITPNGDGVNDYLRFTRLEYFPNSELTIFNRWGAVVYSSSDYRNNWNGDDLSDGVYYYILKISKINQTLKGNVTITR